MDGTTIILFLLKFRKQRYSYGLFALALNEYILGLLGVSKATLHYQPTNQSKRSKVNEN